MKASLSPYALLRTLSAAYKEYDRAVYAESIAIDSVIEIEKAFKLAQSGAGDHQYLAASQEQALDIAIAARRSAAVTTRRAKIAVEATHAQLRVFEALARKQSKS